MSNSSSPRLLPLRRLDSNALLCDCDLMWLAELLKKYALQGNPQTTATCESPRELQGRSIITLSTQEFNCGEHLAPNTPTSVSRITLARHGVASLSPPSPAGVSLHLPAATQGGLISISNRALQLRNCTDFQRSSKIC